MIGKLALALTLLAGYEDAGDFGFEPGPLVAAEVQAGEGIQFRLGGSYAFTPKSYTGTDEGYAWDGYGTLAAYHRTGIGLAVSYRYSGWEAEELDGSTSSKSGGTAYAGPSFRWKGGFFDLLINDESQVVGELRASAGPGLTFGLRGAYDEDYGESYTALVGWKF